jgi:hypothetical protein
MRDYLTISINVDSGEADLTSASREYIDAMIESADLWDYDVLSDMANIFTNAFEACRTKYDDAGKLLFERAELAREQVNATQAHT